MHLHQFGLIVIILLLLTSILILCSICCMKVYKLLYGTFESDHNLPSVSQLDRSFHTELDARTIQTRIKFLRKPYKRMKESHERNMPTIVEVSTPVDSDALGFDESNETVAVHPNNNGGVTNYWKKETIIVI